MRPIIFALLSLTACQLPSDHQDGNGGSLDGASSDGHDSTTGLGGSGQSPESTDSSTSTTSGGESGCEPTDCPEPPPPDSCILPEGGTSCQSVAFVGTVICEDSGLGDLCWPVVAAQYEGYEGLWQLAVSSLFCDQPEAKVLCAAPPIGALPWATCHMLDVPSCEANAAAAGIIDPDVTAICEELVAEAF